MPHGGRLEIRVRSVEIDRAFADAHLGVTPGHHAEVLVRDGGAGMSPEVRSHLFEPYFTTKADRGGTGLGLSTVHASVEQAGGTIWVETEPGRGTTFRILIPEAVGAPEKAHGARARRAPGGSERVAIVEDDTTVRALATTVLSRAGYRLTVKADPREAALLDPSTLDLLLTDVVMPHLDGPGLAACLRAIRPDLPVLFMSGYADRADTSDMSDLTNQPLLAKPFGPVELLAAVRRALDEPG
jgi:CheY-like chemotaxis protein